MRRTAQLAHDWQGYCLAGGRAASDEIARPVVIKRALPHLLNIEREFLKIMIDNIENAPSLVLEYLDDNVLDVCSQKRLESSDVKVVARTVLEALAVLHEESIVHTDVKPDNVLINYGNDGTRSSKVALGDCGNTSVVFRSPEAQLNRRWGPPTDIWSLGATLISLIFGGDWHICVPVNVSFDNEYYAFWVFVEQLRHFGPFNDNLEEIANAERRTFCTGAIDYICENKKWLPFSICEDDELARPDRDFIAKMMKLDPRDRPTARELL
ncbi:hypothetical protein MMC12_004479 [Toensbergia leucococca]|nr:hypothetical protein [Toensbergia leucococca]